jgi:hypothetical protein
MVVSFDFSLSHASRRPVCFSPASSPLLLHGQSAFSPYTSAGNLPFPAPFVPSHSGRGGQTSSLPLPVGQSHPPHHTIPHHTTPTSTFRFTRFPTTCGPRRLTAGVAQVPCPFGLSSCFYWDKVVAYLQPLSSVNGVGIAATLWQDYKLGAMAQFLVISS